MARSRANGQLILRARSARNAPLFLAWAQPCRRRWSGVSGDERPDLGAEGARAGPRHLGAGGPARWRCGTALGHGRDGVRAEGVERLEAPTTPLIGAHPSMRAGGPGTNGEPEQSSYRPSWEPFDLGDASATIFRGWIHGACRELVGCHVVRATGGADAGLDRRAGRLAARTANAKAEPPGDPARGHDLARQSCSSCHLVDLDQRGPVPDDPSLMAIAARPGETENHLLGSLISPPHPLMPSTPLDRQQMRDVYILYARRDHTSRQMPERWPFRLRM